jgi:hypothetical protein
VTIFNQDYFSKITTYGGQEAEAAKEDFDEIHFLRFDCNGMKSLQQILL